MLEKFLEYIKTHTKIVLLGGLGVALLAVSFLLNAGLSREAEVMPNLAPVTVDKTEESYTEAIGAKLEEILSQVDGAGKVKVLVTLAATRERVLASDSTSDTQKTKETDQNGGVREIELVKTNDSRLVIREKDGSESPIVIKEYEAKVEGVIVVAQGGGIAQVKDGITRAVCAALGIEAHKVSILKMKGEK